MGYRDNLKNRVLPHARLADFYTVMVVYFCSGEWCVFIPALTLTTLGFVKRSGIVSPLNNRIEFVAAKFICCVN